MMDPDTADEILWRTGAMSMLYYPELPAEDLDFRLARDVDSVLHELTDLGPVDRDQLRRLIGRTIVDPTRHRQALFAAVCLTSDTDPA